MGKTYVELCGDSAEALTPRQEVQQAADMPHWQGIAEFICRDQYGNVKWEETVKNALTLEGANSMLEVYFNGGTQIAQNAWYASLYTVTPTTALTGATATTNELSGATGYARQNIATWTLSQVTNWRVTAATVTFTAGGAWTAVTAAAFVNASAGAAGKALSFIALSQSRTLANGDSLQLGYYIQLS